jgi:chemotaxis protein CheD
MTALAGAVARAQHVNVADFAVAREVGTISTIGLGSCIAVVLYDEEARVGALAHVLLPHESLSREQGHPAKFATTAVPLLLREMQRLGSGTGCTARIAGGASMFGALLNGGGVNMGERNIVATRRALDAAGIPLVAEDVGGDYGRSVHLDVASGVVRVVSMRHGERTL